MTAKLKDLALAIVIIGAVVTAVYWIVFAIMLHQRGQYAGLFYGEAKSKVSGVLAHQLGVGTSSQLSYRGEAKTHLLGGLGSQVRVFRFVGPHGAHYCVSVWGGGNRTQFEKGCVFS